MCSSFALANLACQLTSCEMCESEKAVVKLLDFFTTCKN